MISLQSVLKSFTQDQYIRGEELIATLNNHKLTHENLASVEVRPIVTRAIIIVIFIILQTVLTEAEACGESIPLPHGSYSVLSKVATIFNIFHNACKEDKSNAENYRFFNFQS